MSIKLESINCDLCGSNNNTLLLRTRDYRYSHPEMFNIVKCKECGLIYLNPRPTFEAISKLYDEDYTPDNELNNPSFVRKTPKWKIVLRRIWYKESGYVDNFPHKGKVLDFGCSKGSVLEILEEEGCEAWGIETNPKSVTICNKKGLNVVCGKIDEVNFPDDFFDAVIMSQVFEHLPSPKRTLEEIKRIIKPGGRIFIYCPNVESYLSKLFGKYWHGWHIPFHFYNFTPESISRLVNECGFGIENISTATPPHFFTTSLTSFLRGKSNNILPSIKRGKLLDNSLVKVSLLPVFRVLDVLLKGKGDCLRVELMKKE